MDNKIKIYTFLWLLLVSPSLFAMKKLSEPEKKNRINQIQNLITITHKSALHKKIILNKKLVPITDKNLSKIIGSFGITVDSNIKTVYLPGVIIINLCLVDQHRCLLKKETITKLLEHKTLEKYEDLYAHYCGMEKKDRFAFCSKLLPEFQKLLKQDEIVNQLVC